MILTLFGLANDITFWFDARQRMTIEEIAEDYQAGLWFIEESLRRNWL
jgi:hypothetical protein